MIDKGFDRISKALPLRSKGVAYVVLVLRLH